MHVTHLHTIDLNLLVALHALFETRSVTAAAGRIDLSQPAMSRVLGRLRKTFDDALFVRSPLGLTPTPRALALQSEVLEILLKVHGLINQPTAFEVKTVVRSFTIATADHAQAVLLPEVIAAIRSEAPGVSLRIVPKVGNAREPLANGAWDFVWTPRDQEPSGNLIWNRLLREDFRFIVSRRHRAARETLTLKSFLSIPQIALAPEGKPGNPLDAALARHGVSRTVVAHVPSFLLVPSIVESSDLGAVLPRRIIERAKSHYEISDFELPFTATGFELSQGWHERMRHDAGHVWLRGLVRRLAAAI